VDKNITMKKAGKILLIPITVMFWLAACSQQHLL